MTFKGPIISCSSYDEYAKGNLAAGASDWCLSVDVAAKVKEVLKAQAFSWFAYFDEEDGVGRAVCPMLGFLVERPRVQEAVAEMLDVADDYLKMKAAANESDVVRPTPAVAWEASLTRFVAQCSAKPEGQGQFWACGLIR